MTTEFEDVLIVIPCLNEEAHLPELLGAMVADAPGATVVVADGGSRDRSRAIVEEWAARTGRVHLLDNPARLQSAGINLAAQRFGRGRRWLVRVDAHCGYPRDYVRGLVHTAERRRAVSVVVPMRTRGQGCFQRAAAAAQNSLLGTGGSAHRHVGGEGRYVEHGHHALMRLDAFLVAGGYCERQATNEDAELDHRLALAGGQLWLEPSLALDYYPRRDPAALFRQYHRYGIGRAMTIARHRMRPKPRQMAPLVVAPAVLLAVLAPVWWPLSLPALAWALICLGYGLLLGVQARSGCVAMSGVAIMIMHLSWSIGVWRQWLTGRSPGPTLQPLAAD